MPCGLWSEDLGFPSKSGFQGASLRDVIVVGAGPAGNMAALRMAESGLNVAVLDWRAEIGDKLCTGIIGRECVAKFPPKPEHVYREAGAATIVSPFGRRFRVERSEPQAYIVDRAAYVNSFADSAISAGAHYLLEHRVTSLTTDKNSAKVTATHNGREKTLEAKMVVLAGGFGSPLLRMAGLSSGRPQDYMIGCQAIVEAPDLSETEVFVGSEVVPQSFAWVVPLSHGRALVGMAPRDQVGDRMDRLTESLKRSGVIKNVLGQTQTWGIPIRPLPKTYGTRVLVVGDSAGLVKPTTGGGIYYALLSGELAAHAIGEAFEAGKFSSRQLARYEKAWKGVFGRELRVGYYARMMFETLADEQLESLMEEFLSERMLNEVMNSPDFSFDWHSHVILKVLRHTNIRKIIRSFGPAVAPFAARLLRARV